MPRQKDHKLEASLGLKKAEKEMIELPLHDPAITVLV
jgi:hypothetical protein